MEEEGRKVYDKKGGGKGRQRGSNKRRGQTKKKHEKLN